jgi:glycosyltransferase involved in cell wall biosynthesis
MDKRVKVGVFNFSSSAGGSSSIAETLIKVLESNYNITCYAVYGKSKKRFYLNQILHRVDNLISLLLFRTYKNVSVNVIPTNNPSWVNSMDADIIHFHWIHFNFFSFWDILKIRKPIIWTLHDAWVVNRFGHLEDKSSELFSSFVSFLHKMKLSRLQQANIEFVCPSKWLYEKLMATGVYPVGKIHQIYNPIDVDFWVNDNYLANQVFHRHQANEIRILFVSNENIENVNKGFQMLVEISKLAKIWNISIVFEVVCPINDPLKINDYSFIFHGKKNKTELRDLYRKVDMLILPSIIENLPTVLIEALSTSCPVIAYNSGGVSEIVEDKVNGILVKNYEADEFLKGINYLKNNLELFKSKARPSVCNKFDYSSAYKLYSEIYESII